MPLISPPLPSDGDDITQDSNNDPLLAILSLVNGNLDQDNLVNGGVNANKLASGSVTAAKLADASVTGRTLDINLRQGWTALPDGVFYDNGTIKFVGVDYTALFMKGDRIKYTNNALQKYGYVKGTVLSGGDTLLQLYTGTDYLVEAGACTNVYFSKESTPSGFPTNMTSTNGFFYMSGSVMIQYAIYQFNSPSGVSSYTSTLTYAYPYANNAYAFSLGGLDASGFASGAETPIVNWTTKTANGINLQCDTNGGVNTLSARVTKIHWRAEGIV